MLGALLFIGPRTKTVAGVTLVLGGAVVIAVGPFPGLEWEDSPSAQWFAGAALGVCAFLAMRRLGRLRRRLQTLPGELTERLIPLTLDFRHGGMETRGLLDLESRARNLFLHDGLHEGFHSELRSLASRYAEGTGARLGRLVQLAGLALPDLVETSKLREANAKLETLCSSPTQSEEDEEALREWSREVEQLARRVRSAVNELLAAVDLKLGTDVREVIQETSNLVADQIRSEGIRLSIEFEPPGEVLALIPRADLLLVLENLFAGSIAAVQGMDERWIEVSCRHALRRVTVRFQDSGPGVPGDLWEKIFEFGFTTRPSGTGYGLARSREILGKFGGSISLVEGESGAAFLITLHGILPTWTDH